jgi:signal transduction histidine kinase
MGAKSLEPTEHEEGARSDVMGAPASGATPSTAARPEALMARELASASTCPPAEWLDELTVAAASLAPDATMREVAAAILGVGSRALPAVAIGACVPDLDGGQLVVRLFDAGAADVPPSPARLFPDHRAEHVLRVPHDDGSTVHLGSSAADLVGPASAALAFADRLARALGSALRHARAHEAARRRVAELYGLEAQLIHQSKLASLGQMAAGIVHELNNPLTSIIAYADYLRKKGERQSADPADVERLRRIGEAAERIQRFARDLVTFSRPGATTPSLLPIHEVIDRALLFCEHVLDQTGVRVERSFARLPRVRGVPDQLTQVFVNLFTNAAHAMRDGGGGVLRITTATAGVAEVAITIADDGHGVDAAHLPHIFDPFFTTKTDGSGTGLGLSIVRNIVVAHGGRIRADGLEPHGMAFHVHLPAAADEA